ncbi:MAG: RagB/SusD family nutrient uptake outer membrane protein [Bacteroidales bacterium]|nr:RagB/SusD family nutrient uptake outer membrane protein [Candidatus Physcousia equi]
MKTIKHKYMLGLKASAFSLMLAAMGLTSCSDFLNDQKPQGTMDDNQIMNPKYIDNLIISAYAGLVTIEDMNSSFSLWNYDSRSDDAYIAGGGPSDAGKFFDLSLGTNVHTTDWIFNDIWNRIYKFLSRVNRSLDVLSVADQANPIIQQRTAEMKFLRAYGHFQLKRLFKNIPFVNQLNMTEEDYRNITNNKYSNNDGWQQIANDLKAAVEVLPATQTEKGRPSKASAAALLAKVYLYKAYRQDNPKSNQVTSINKDDLDSVVKYTQLKEYYTAFDLEADMHDNFRPEEQFENGVESVWAIQYSKNDGTDWGNLNYSNRLIVPCIPDVHNSGCDFYKPSNTLVDAYITSVEGLPTNAHGYEVGSSMTVDPRLFITVGVPGTPYMFNTNFMIEKSDTWSRAGKGVYGWNVSLKQNVDPDLVGKYLFNVDNQWASSMNRNVIRYADVLLMRAEALALLGNHDAEAVALVNQVRNRAAGMVANSIVSGYATQYSVRFNIKPYPTTLSGEKLVKAIKTERRLEFAMESERFFDLVRWGEAAATINDFYQHDGKDFLKNGHFTADKNEYLPIPHEQIAASNGKYVQNIGNW